MPKFLMKVHHGTLVPADSPSEEYLTKFKDGNTLFVDARKARNPAHHRKAFAVLSFAQKNQDTYPSVDMLLEAVKIYTGHVDEMYLAKRIYYKTKSISFSQMGQDEFSEFYVKMLDALAYLTGIPAETLEEGGRTPEV